MSLTSSIRIAVVCGGSSAEAEISRITAKGVANALLETYQNVSLVELDSNIAKNLLSLNPSVVFPALHGPVGEDGTFQGFLETLHIPYVGSGVQASTCAMNKIIAKHIFRSSNLPVAKDVIVYQKQGSLSVSKEIRRLLGDHVVVKPASLGSALGVRFASSEDEIAAALELAFQYDTSVLVEQTIVGKEITVAVLDRDGLEALPIIEIKTPPNTWYDFKHRYTAGLSEHIVPAPLPEEQYRRVQQIAKAAHEVLGCRDLSRADFVVPEVGEPVLLEVNTLPGMTPTSLYPDAAKAAGISFKDLVSHLIELALTRAPFRN